MPTKLKLSSVAQVTDVMKYNNIHIFSLVFFVAYYNTQTVSINCILFSSYPLYIQLDVCFFLSFIIMTTGECVCDYSLTITQFKSMSMPFQLCFVVFYINLANTTIAFNVCIYTRLCVHLFLLNVFFVVVFCSLALETMI